MRRRLRLLAATVPLNVLLAGALLLVTAGHTPGATLPTVEPFRADDTAPSRQLPPADILRVMTLNLAHGRSDAFHQAFESDDTIVHNLDRVGRLLRQRSPDLVALQEADGPSSWSGSFDHVRYVAHRGGLRHSFRGTHARSSALGIEYGTGLASQVPLWTTHSHAFASSWRDTKGFVVATIQIPGFGNRGVDVVSVHLDFMTDTTRREQLEEMIDVLSGRHNPLVVLGDLNCTWAEGQSCVQFLAAQLALEPHEPDAAWPTYPSTDPNKRIDWILISKQLEFVTYETLADRVSDHLGVVADLRFRQPIRSATLVAPAVSP